MNSKEMQKEMSPEKLIEMFTHEVTSEHLIEAVTEKIPEACEQHKFALLQTYVYHEIVERKGFPIKRKVFIYEICQAKTAAAMLTEFPYFSIYMPCKLAIYEDRGKTIISTMNMEMMLNAISSNPELYKDTKTLFVTLKSLMVSIS
jgi:uncharacterized protein (DUF302 family)